MKRRPQTRSIELSRRAFAGLPASVDVDSRSFPIIITTETPVRTWIPNPRLAQLSPAQLNDVDVSFIEVDEVLLTEGLDYSRVPRMPLLDNHDTVTGTRAILGRVDNVRPEEGQIVGLAVLTNERSSMIQDLAEGFYGQISAGYCVNAYEIVDREGDVPLAIATSWTLLEASLVPIGADLNATVRGQSRKFPMPKFSIRASDGDTKPKEKTMDDTDLEQLVDAATDALNAVADASDDGASDEVAERARRLRDLADSLNDDDDDQARKRRRGKRDDDNDDDQERKRGKRDGDTGDNNGDEDDAPLSDDEEDDLDDVQDEARARGLRAFARKVRKLKADPAKARAALPFLRSALKAELASGRSSFADASRDARRNSEPRRSDEREPVVDTDKIYKRANSRFRGRRA